MMMTTAETAATDTILAIDLGKYKSVACHSPALNEQSFVKFATTTICFVPPQRPASRPPNAAAIA